MKIAEEVQGAKTIGLSAHVRPDGDAMGSCMGLSLFLKKILPQARIDVFLGEVSPALERNMAGAETICHDYITDVDSYDVFICCDCECERLGDALPFFRAAKKTINIDHHISNPGSGDVNYIVPTASSACELVWDVIDHDLVDEPIARDLYIGMFTDTGVFKFSNTSQKTMEIAGQLITYGFDFPRIIQEIYFQMSYIRQQILGRALLESFLFLDGKCITSMIDRKTMQFYRATSSDMEGVVSQLIDTEGVEVAVFMYEVEPMTYKVSLRSNGVVDVAKVAQILGGGGHVRASGCTVHAEYHDILNAISGPVEEQLIRAGVLKKEL